MIFDTVNVPVSLVEIVGIRKKNGKRWPTTNWRYPLIGRRTFCCLAGGFDGITLFFKMAAWMDHDEVEDVDIKWEGNTSIGFQFPVEIEPDIYEFTTTTSVYRFRLLSHEESEKVRISFDAAIAEEMMTSRAVFRPFEDVLN